MWKILFIICSLSFEIKADVYNDVKNSRNFTGKVVLVTGSTSGMGESVAKLFSSLGAKVVVTGRNKIQLEKAGNEVSELSPHGLKALKIMADLSKEDEVSKLIDQTIKELGKLDVLVNSAAVLITDSIKDSNISQKCDIIFSNNVRPIIQLIHLSIPYLEKTKGTVISISSLAAIFPFVKEMCYGMAKASLDIMTKVLAVELGSTGIRVNSINPGATATSMLKKLATPTTDHFAETVVRITPLQRFGIPDDMAKAIVFLASSDAQFITGVNLLVDGGIRYNLPADIMGSN